MKKRIIQLLSFLCILLVLLLPGSILASEPAGAETNTTAEQFVPIKRGDSGDRVVEAQEMLCRSGCLLSAIDGDFGPLTEQSVKDFQEAVGLEITGIINKETYHKLTAEKK